MQGINAVRALDLCPDYAGESVLSQREFIAVGLTGFYEWIKRALCLCEKTGENYPLCAGGLGIHPLPVL